MNLIRLLFSKYFKKKKFYIRRIKPTDCWMHFDPFDHMYGGGGPVSYPKFGEKRILYTMCGAIICRWGIFKYNDEIKDLCHEYKPSKKELISIMKDMESRE